MILGRKDHLHSACFDELDHAVGMIRAGTWKKGDPGPVVLNAHSYPDHIPKGAIVYNLENVGVQVETTAFQGHQLWDFSRGNVAKWEKAGRVVKYVPVGYHVTMERFKRLPWNECKYDIVFTGSPCVRRHHVLDELSNRGLRVCQVPHVKYGKERDVYLASSRLALNIQYYEKGVHPVLRSAHCVANGLPVLSETAPEIPDWALLQAPYQDLVERAYGLVTRRREFLDHLAEASYRAFRMCPMVLP